MNNLRCKKASYNFTINGFDFNPRTRITGPLMQRSKIWRKKKVEFDAWASQQLLNAQFLTQCNRDKRLSGKRDSETRQRMKRGDESGSLCCSLKKWHFVHLDIAACCLCQKGVYNAHSRISPCFPESMHPFNPLAVIRASLWGKVGNYKFTVLRIMHY